MSTFNIVEDTWFGNLVQLVDKVSNGESLDAKEWNRKLHGMAFQLEAANDLGKLNLDLPSEEKWAEAMKEAFYSYAGMNVEPVVREPLEALQIIATSAFGELFFKTDSYLEENENPGLLQSWAEKILPKALTPISPKLPNSCEGLQNNMEAKLLLSIPYLRMLSKESATTYLDSLETLGDIDTKLSGERKGLQIRIAAHTKSGVASKERLEIFWSALEQRQPEITEPDFPQELKEVYQGYSGLIKKAGDLALERGDARQAGEDAYYQNIMWGRRAYTSYVERQAMVKTMLEGWESNLSS